jgi:uncharacterized protein YecE (DUF72 family)
MKFGQLSHPRELEQIRFELPPLDPRSLKEVNRPLGFKPKIYFGCPLWAKKEWVGELYPKGTPQKDFLKVYAQQFNSIELNATYYRIPDPKTVLKWKESVPQGFRFSPKFFQGISRFNSLNQIPELTKRFCDSVLHFEDQLGISFLQLQPNFGPDRILLLKRFFTLLPKGFRLGVEFRHPEWFERGRLIPSAFELLSINGISAVITDTAGKREVLHNSITSKSALIRFLGNEYYPTDQLRVDQWLLRMEELFASGLDELYFFIHQPNEEQIFPLFDRLVTSVNQKFQLQLKSRQSDPSFSQGELF